MPILNNNSTNYEHPWEPNLADLHTAMEYRPDGKPQLRVGLQADRVVLQGDVYVSQVEISNDDGNPIPVSANTATNTTNNPIYTVVSKNTATNSVNNPIDVMSQQGTTPWLTQFYDSNHNMQMDAVNRLRVSQAYDTWWYAPSVDADGDLRYIDQATGTGASTTFVQLLSSISLSSGTDANGSLIRMSRRRHKMRPTVSIRASFSLNWNGYDSNIAKRAGMFTNFNGIFWEVSDDLYAVIRRRLADGTLVEKRISRANFNADQLDGTKSSYDLRGATSPHTFTTGITGYVSTAVIAVPGDGTVYNVTYTVADRSKFFAGLKGLIRGVTPATFNGVCMVSDVSGSQNLNGTVTGPGNVTFTFLVNPGAYVSMSSATFYHDVLFHQYVFGFDFNGNRNSSVRFFINGTRGRVIVHTEDFGDTQSTPIFNAPAVSTRYEIVNKTAPVYRPSFLVSSETVSEESPPSNNPAFGVAVNNTYLTYPKAGTAEYPIVGVALRPGEPYQRADLQLQSIGLTDLNNYGNQNTNPGTFYWRLVLNPTINGTMPASTNVGRASRQWAFTTANAVSGGITLMSGYAQSQSPAISVRDAFTDINLGANVDYTDSDRVVLVVQQIRGGTNDAQIVGTINFTELL